MKVKDFVPFKNWVVVGDVLNESKSAARILRKLHENGYQVAGVHPRGGGNGSDSGQGTVCVKLADAGFKIDVIDLCINPGAGLDYIKEAAALGVDKVLIQPGAASQEILDFCQGNGITAVEGCAMVMLSGG
ncbi:MAG: CoA-binding protein [Peptococcaceae bacterium]|jgi:predicted CoA-binding protein|nr:CoA-binding protein [Peptococcaceae bacterium]MDR2736664.1 CoA-binding protein [Gracilibacteraceae bacterium]